MPIEHEVKFGEYLSGIAVLYGFCWKTVWNHGLNAELKAKRKNPNILFPGDIVRIPDKQETKESRPTNAKHKFKLKGEQSVLRVIVRVDGQPLDKQPYHLIVEDTTYTGTTTDKGELEQLIPSNARRGVLRVGPSGSQVVRILAIGDLDPIEEIRGIQHRLNNLGFACGKEDGVMGPKTEGAVRRFQAFHGLGVDGVPGPVTQAQLEKEHGS